MLREQLKQGGKVLDVGSGTGYLTAILAHMVGTSGQVVGIEHIPELLQMAIDKTRKHQQALLDSGRLRYVQGDGRQGHAEGGPYDAIHVGAAAPTLPMALIEQLAPGGRLVISVGQQQQELMVYDKQQDGRVIERSAMSVIYVPLTSREYQLSRA